jgi:surfeit locus 1 family protein
MRVGRFEFNPSPVLTVATLLAVGGCIRLGLWQLERAAEKAQIADMFAQRVASAPLDLGQAMMPNDEWRYRPAYARGTYVATGQVLLDNKIAQGRPGYHVLTPLRIAGSERIVLVNRGWVPWGPNRATRPHVSPPAGVTEVHGRLDALPAKPFGLTPPSTADWGWRWPFFDAEQFHRQLQLKPEPYLLLQDPQPSDSELVREWPLPAAGGQRHIAYAIQWFAFAIIGTVVYFKLTLNKPSTSQP